MCWRSGAAVYLNWQFAGTGVQVEEESSAETSSALGAAQLVNNNYVETVSDGVESTAGEVSKPDAEATQAKRPKRRPRRPKSCPMRA